MKIPLSEIWNFIDLIDRKERGWSYALHSANVIIPNLQQDVLFSLKKDDHYDTELLPSLFTFREVLWQPDVFTEAPRSLPGIRILRSFCEETCTILESSDNKVNKLYLGLVKGIAEECQKAESLLEGNPKDAMVTRALGELRRNCFPIIKFFIFHPKNRLDYYRDALNRLNYAVKIMLTQFNGKYTDLADPYWIVEYHNTTRKIENPMVLKVETL